MGHRILAIINKIILNYYYLISQRSLNRRGTEIRSISKRSLDTLKTVKGAKIDSIYQRGAEICSIG